MDVISTMNIETKEQLGHLCLKVADALDKMTSAIKNNEDDDKIQCLRIKIDILLSSISPVLMLIYKQLSLKYTQIDCCQWRMIGNAFLNLKGNE